MANVTQILSAIEAGDPKAAGELLPLVYGELRKLAAARMAQESPGQTLQPTDLVHEAYLRLVGGGQPDGWGGRGHFFAAAAEAMRRILVERARRRRRVKHGGDRRRVDLDDLDGLAVPADDRVEDVVAVDEVLDRFAAEEPEAAEVVKLRYFVGLTAEQAADALGISLRTANRHWAYARAWLFQALGRGGASEK
jgi:RNA polymerase sigma factor (TIGR02999 family)